MGGAAHLRREPGVPILANDPHRRIEMPALRYFVHLVAPGWNVIGGGGPPFAGVDVGNNERMAWGFTFAGTDMVDVYVEEMHPEDPNLVRWQDGWEPLRVIEEEIPVKGQAPEPIVLKFSRHGPVFYEDLEHRRAYAVRSVVQEPGTAAYKGSFQLGPGRELHRLLRPGDALAGADPQPHLRRRRRQHRAAGDRAHPRPRRLERAVAGTRHRRLRVARVPDRPAARVQPGAGLHRHRQQQRASAGYEGRPVFYHSSRGFETSVGGRETWATASTSRCSTRVERSRNGRPTGSRCGPPTVDAGRRKSRQPDSSTYA